MRRRLLSFAALLATIAAVLSVNGQDGSKTSSPSKTLSWDVISVKPNHSLDGSSFMRMTPNGFETHNMTLDGLFINAFGVHSENQILGYPSWVASDRFDIQAKMDADTVAAYHALKGQESGEQ